MWRQGAGGSDQDGLQVLRLVDVQNKCIAKFNRAEGNYPKHAVLSYVIGDRKKLERRLPKYDKHDMKAKQSDNSLHFHKLPEVYQDAIEVAKDVGLPYLWIDAMCFLDKDAGDYERG